MLPKIMDEDQLKALVGYLLKEYDVFSPVPKNKYDYSFQKISSFEEMDISPKYKRTTYSAKKLFLPPKDRIISGSKSKGDFKRNLSTDKRTVIGMRPCDITATILLDMVFEKDYSDDFYLERRKNTLIIGLRCLEKCENCFCGTMESSNPKGGFDLMLTLLGDGRYYVEPGSVKGRTILNEQKEFFSKVDNEARKLIKEAFVKIANTFTPDFPIQRIYSALDDLIDNKEKWSDHAKKCLACGQCTWVCPTCWCLGVEDKIELDLDTVHRERSWNSCLFPEFALVAGGHNFRPDQGSRLQHYYYHKIVSIPEHYHTLGCVGCGRCISTCPVGIDIHENIMKFMEADET